MVPVLWRFTCLTRSARRILLVGSIGIIFGRCTWDMLGNIFFTLNYRTHKSEMPDFRIISTTMLTTKIEETGNNGVGLDPSPHLSFTEFLAMAIAWKMLFWPMVALEPLERFN